MTGKHYPTIKDSIFLLIFLFAIMIALFLILMITGLALGWMTLNQVGDLLAKNPHYLGMINLVSISLALWWGYKRIHGPIGQVFPLRPVPGSIFLPVGLLMIGIAILLSDLDNLLRWVLHTPADQNDILVQLLSSKNIWGLAFILVMVAPLTEEFLFRGLVLTGFVNNYRVSKAMWVSALLFAVFHMNIYQMPGAFVSGLVFAWLVVKTGSLWPSLFGHALTNGLPIIVERVFNLQIPGFTYQLEGQILFQPLWLDGAGLALVGLGLWLLWPKLKESLEPGPELLREERPSVESLAGLEVSGEVPLEAPPIRPGKLGIVALIIGIVSTLILIGGIILAVYGVKNSSQTLTLLGGMFFILVFPAAFVGIAFGIAAIIRKNQIPAAVVGIGLNSIYLLLIITFLIIGLVNLNGGRGIEMLR